MKTANRAYISFDQWLVFKTVLETGSFTATAQELNRSQSAISQAIHKMEELMGAQLFELEGRRVKATKLAKSLKLPAERLINEAIAIEKLAVDRPAELENNINICATVAFPNEILFKSLKSFSEQFPSVSINLDQGVFSSTVEAIVSGKADLAICPFIPNGFVGTSIYAVDAVPVAHSQSVLASKNRMLTISDLRQHTQVVIKDDSKLMTGLGSLGGEHSWLVANIESAIEAIKSGIGFCWIPTHLIEEELNTGILKILPLEATGIYKGSLQLVYGQSSSGFGCKALANILIKNCINQ